jgi:hypothetical protein
MMKVELCTQTVRGELPAKDDGHEVLLVLFLVSILNESVLYGGLRLLRQGQRSMLRAALLFRCRGRATAPAAPNLGWCALCGRVTISIHWTLAFA